MTNPKVNIGFNDERLQVFMLRSGTKQGCLLLFLVNIVLEILTEQSGKENLKGRSETVSVCK